MFTGIVTDVGEITAVKPGGAAGDRRFVIRTKHDMKPVAMGASIACSGFTRDFIHVVQRGALYDNPADGDGLQARNRGQSAGATHLGLYVENAGGSLAGLELVSDGPPRRARNRAQSTLELGAVDFYNQAIDFVRQIVAPSLHLLALPKDFFHALADASKGYRP